MAKLKTGRHTSAIKAHRQSVKHAIENRRRKTAMKSTLKILKETIQSGKSAEAKALLSQTISVIDRAAKKGVLHTNSAQRRISKISKQVYLLQK